MLTGDKAPNFSLFNDSGEKTSLSDLLSNNVILYFYPKDDTPGCTQEAKDFTELTAEFAELSVQVVGISKDNISSHHTFKQKYDIQLLLLSDESTEVIQKYKVWVEKSMFGKKYMGIERSTFLINKNSEIIQVWRKVKIRNHAQEVLEACQKHFGKTN